MRWSALLLVWGVAAAQEDLLKVGKTPAEKLEQETQQAKDNVEAALQKYEQKKQLMTQTVKALEPSSVNSLPTGGVLPDPTQADPEFQRQFRAMLRGATASPGQEALPPMPQIALTAKVEYRGHHPIAMLRVDGRDVLIRQNDTLSVLSQGHPITIQVREVDQHAVTVELRPHNLLLTLR